MTGFMHEKEFSRKSFLKGGGALVVGFSAFASTAGKARGQSSVWRHELNGDDLLERHQGQSQSFGLPSLRHEVSQWAIRGTG